MYKILHEGTIIDVVRNPSFVKFLSSGHIAITDKTSAQGIVGSDKKTVYSFTPSQDTSIKTVSIETIEAEEFNRLKSLLNSSSSDELALQKVKDTVVKTLSEICNNKITSGFSIKLSDGQVYSFSLTTEDQLNLLCLENQLSTGEDVFVYHAIGLPCKLFARNDMIKIINAYRKHVRYHTTYFNTAKHYVNSLTDINKIKTFSYGTDVTYTTKDPVLRKILIDGGIS
jgi:hypothetical protein